MYLKFISLNLEDHAANLKPLAVSLKLCEVLRMYTMFYFRLNAALCDVPSNLELRYAINTRHSLRRKMPVLTKTIVDCNFGVAPVDSQNTCTSFKLKNGSTRGY